MTMAAPPKVKYRGKVYLKVAEAPKQVKYKGRIYVKAASDDLVGLLQKIEKSISAVDAACSDLSDDLAKIQTDLEQVDMDESLEPWAHSERQAVVEAVTNFYNAADRYLNTLQDKAKLPPNLQKLHAKALAVARAVAK